MSNTAPETANLPRSGNGIALLHPASGKTIYKVPLRLKGLLAFFAVVIYAVLLTNYTFDKKSELVGEFDQLQNLYKVEDDLRQVDAAVLHIVMAVFLSHNTGDKIAVAQRFRENFELLKKKNIDLTARHPASSLNLAGIEQAMAQAAEHPTAEGLAAMNSELLKVKINITRSIEESRKKQKVTAERFQMQWDSAALASLLFGLLGLLLLGTIIGLFFSRLANDLHTLKARALGIINGERSALNPVTRNDEVGELMQAVNQMASDLDARENELIIARQKYFHQEKMAAVGALAAGVAHEIGNPIAAMAGVLQEMADAENSGQAIEHKDDKLALLQSHIHRLSAITREISQYAAPQPMELQLLDLNALIRTTAGLMSYDKRMERVNLKLHLDNQLPAINGVADQLTQVIMNLLINAADAIESADNQPPEIILRTEVIEGNVRFQVTDNGSGMNVETLNRAFEAFFTTKSKGTGLGLALCYSIITGHGGTIEIDSIPGKGTTVRATLPLNANDGDDTDERL